MGEDPEHRRHGSEEKKSKQEGVMAVSVSLLLFIETFSAAGLLPRQVFIYTDIYRTDLYLNKSSSSMEVCVFFVTVFPR